MKLTSNMVTKAASLQAGEAVESEFGLLPEWNLSDLYGGMTSPEFQSDFDSCVEKAQKFERTFKGKLQQIINRNGDELAQAIANYEILEDELGRIISFAGLIYAGDSADPAKGKFYGDVQERLTQASSHLLFFTLELNQLDDAAIKKAAANSAQLAHYLPWLTDLRLDKPYQLDDQIERLFLEKSSTGAAAFNRLFDETMSGLRFKGKDGEELAIEPMLNRLQDKSSAVRKSASDALASTFNDNIRLFTLITNTLAKDKQISDGWRGFEDVADSRHLANRVERPVVDALVAAVEDAFPRISHRYYKMKAKWMGMDVLNHWDRNAPLPEGPQRVIKWEEAQQTVLRAYEGFSPSMANIAQQFFDKNWIDAPGQTRKISRCLRPSNRPLSTSLYPAKLSGKAQGCHDACP